MTNESIMNESLLEDINEMGSIMKSKIIEDQKINPNNYVNINQAIQNEYDENFPISILAKNLEYNGITTAVQKHSNNKEQTHTCLQLMTNGIINKKKCEVKFDFGQKQNDEILKNKNEKIKFIEEWKKILSKKLGISQKEIIITNLRKGSLKIDIIFLETHENFNNLVSILNDMSKTSPKIKSFRITSFLDGLILNKYMFDSRGNQNPFNYQIHGLRGGIDYYGPMGWTGHGLSVYGKFDGGDNTWLGMTGTNPGEWCVAYHGTSLEYVSSILYYNFQEGERQSFEYDDDINHPGYKVGKGVYVTPDINIAESYSIEVKGFKCVLMCRVNPFNVRIPKSKPDFWVVDGSFNDIRAYRLLIKKVGNNMNFM